VVTFHSPSSSAGFFNTTIPPSTWVLGSEKMMNE
jgi:hypothetical protein